MSIFSPKNASPARTVTIALGVLAVGGLCAAAWMRGRVKQANAPPPIASPVMPRKPIVKQDAAIEPPPLPEGGVRGIYLTGWTAGLKKRFGELVGLVDRTELNAMVIDVKDDGEVSFDIDVPLARKIHANQHMVSHIDRVMKIINQHQIWPIARITCFRDTPLAVARPDLAVQSPNGGVWRDKTGHAWLNPFNKVCWDYNVDVALAAIKAGFKEIQFDYVRFPSEGKVSTLVYPGKPKKAIRSDQIAAFLKYAHARIHAHGAWFSADVFGLTSLVKDDMGIGQTRTNAAKNVDFLCPMCYPSHYAHGEYGLKNPNLEPYKIVHFSVGDAKLRLKDVPTCRLRPWLQDFSLPASVHYGPNQVKAELKAIHDLGLREFLLWNAGCRYTEAALARDTRPTIASTPTVGASAAPSAPSIPAAPK